MSKSEQIQTPYPNLTKYLVDCIERTANDMPSQKDDSETKESIISRMYDQTKENIKMAHEYIKKRIPSYIDIDKMPLLLSLSIAQHNYTPHIEKIFRIFSSDISMCFTEGSHDSEIDNVWEKISEIPDISNCFSKTIDGTKDIIWFMYFACEEDSKFCGIWCGQSYIDACQSIGYHIKNLSEENFPVISWPSYQCHYGSVYLEDINLRSFLEQGAISSGYTRDSILENMAELMNEESKDSVDPFKILNLTIDKDLFDENSSGYLNEQLNISRKNRLLAVYGKNQLKLLSSSLQTYFKLAEESDDYDNESTSNESD